MAGTWYRGLAAGGLGLLLAGAALADDTELFVSGFDTPASCAVPNVLFIIDTSGSMDSEVQSQADWDPAERYDGCYDPDSLYYSDTGELPDCSSDRMVPKADNYCAAAGTRLDLVGRYKNLFRRWNADRQRWDVLDPAVTAGPLECEADRGVHGDGSSGSAYAADGAGGPWAADAGAEPAWAAASNVTVFDGNWLNWNASPPTVTRTRLDVVKSVTKSLIDSMDGINVAVMRFNEEEGGPVIHAMEDVATARDSAKAVIDSLTADGYTPLSETLYEAQQYLAQRLVDYGDVGPELSVPESRLGAQAGATGYLSPLQSDGQKTFIVLLTDGEPQRDSSADGKITALPDFGALVGTDCDGTGDGRCLDDLAEYLYLKDLRPTVPGIQNAVVHTIGFNLDTDLLASTAARGGGRAFRVDDAASLTTVLSELAETFYEGGGLFAAPAVTVDAFNRAQTLDDIYVSVFEPASTLRWLGNLKKYRLDVRLTGAADAPVDVSLVDRDGRPAVDPATGYFSAGARSFWSNTQDGDQPTLGGAASQLPGPADRVLYTNLSGGELNDPAGNNRVSTANAGIDAALLGAPAAERDQVIEWALGRDVRDADNDGDTTEARLDMGDPLHARPVVVQYGSDPATPAATVYVTTNDGYLQAIDTESGRERWAFIPARLLSRLYGLYVNNDSVTRGYGLDGDLTLYIQNNDGVPGISGSERALLLFGMRRGGQAVFALDVTNRDRPRLLWEIDPGDPDFRDLGQTWSPPQVARVNIGGTDRRVAIFGGGYDTAQDTRQFREDTVGNAIFMVDLATGQRLWSAGGAADHDLVLPRMRFAVPAALRLLDLDNDGRPDRLYFGDMGGQLWRLDLRNGQSAASLADGGVLASLGAADLGNNPPASEIRRFYAAPDVVPVISNQRVYLSVNVGSGYRAHPLDTATGEQFFAVRDFRAYQDLEAADFSSPVTVDQLVDVTDTANAVLEPLDAGWRLRLVQGAGEKVLGEAVTFANTVFFTSFTPRLSGNVCTPAGGTNRAYQVSILTGNPLTNLDGSTQGPLTTMDRFTELRQGGIAPRPTFLFPEGLPPGLGPVGTVGAELLPDVPENGLVRSFWLQREEP